MARASAFDQARRMRPSADQMALPDKLCQPCAVAFFG